MFHKEQPHEHLVHIWTDLSLRFSMFLLLSCVCVIRSHDVYRLMSWMIILMTVMILMADMK